MEQESRIPVRFPARVLRAMNDDTLIRWERILFGGEYPGVSVIKNQIIRERIRRSFNARYKGIRKY